LIETDNSATNLKTNKIPQYLILLGKELEPYHPSVAKSWIKWIQEKNITQSSLSPDGNADTLGHSSAQFDNGDTFVVDDEIDHVTINANRSFSFLDSPKAPSLSGLISKDQLEMKQKELFDNYTAKSSSPALRASDLKSPSTDILDSRKIKDLTAAEEITDMVILIERLGDIVISIKSLYDKLCVDQKQISSRDAMSLLLDMGLRNPMLSKAADMFDDYVEFSKFLYVYCSLAGVTKPSRFGKTTALSDKKYLWIPTISGMWEEIDNDLYEALYRAAEPYKLRSHKSSDSGALAKSREKEKIHSSHYAHELLFPWRRLVTL